MAQIRLLSWNIEVYGPNKYGNVPNNGQIVRFVAQTAVQQNANIVVFQELMTSMADQICFSIADEITQRSVNSTWTYRTVAARPGGDRESYGILWRTGVAPNFAITNNAAGQQNIDLSPLDFPNGFSPTHGRRPAIATFRTTDTNVNFAVYDWHSVPGNPVPGLAQSARTPALYTVNNAGVVQPVTGRILAGDFNMAVTQPEFAWFTNPVPAVPPPVAPGQGAGTTPILPANVPPQFTHLARIADAVRVWGPVLANWSGNSVNYRDYQLDNSFWGSPNPAPAAGGGVIDLIAEIMNPLSALRAIAQNFVLTYPVALPPIPAGAPAFPNAPVIPLPLAANLNTTAVAFLLYRYAISDHLPVFNSVTI